jgi:superfamily II DNA or RNA helicase
MSLPANPAAGKGGVSKKRWGLWRNDLRHAAFAADARAYAADHQVLMLCETIEHAVHMWQHLPEYQLCYAALADEELNFYQRHHYLPQNFQPMTPTLRDGLRAAFERGELKKVIATDVWSTGVNFPHLQTLYRLDGRESGIVNTQLPGRVSRIVAGKEVAEIVDSCDFFDKGFYRRARTRRQHYANNGWENHWPRFGRRGFNYEPAT